MRIIRIIENVTYKEKPRELGWFTWRGVGNGRQSGYAQTVISCVKVSGKQVYLFPVSLVCRKRNCKPDL